MDIEYKINEIVSKAKDDIKFAARLSENPLRTLRQTMGICVTDDQLALIAERVLSKLSEDYAGSVLSSIQIVF